MPKVGSVFGSGVIVLSGNMEQARMWEGREFVLSPILSRKTQDGTADLLDLTKLSINTTSKVRKHSTALLNRTP